MLYNNKPRVGVMAFKRQCAFGRALSGRRCITDDIHSSTRPLVDSVILHRANNTISS